MKTNNSSSQLEIDESKLNQIEIPIIFDGEIMTYQCGKCGYVISCNYKNKYDLTDFMECLLAHDCYEIGEENEI